MSWSSDDVFAALAPVIDVLVSLGVRYRVGGSVASSALGLPRSTLDVDIACELRLSHVDAMVEQLQSTFYIDGDMLRDAIRRQSSANIIHLSTMLKVDLFVRRARPFEDVAFERATRRHIGPREYDVTTAEDIVLHKLEWYRLGGHVSDRQWQDVLGVIAVQREVLDLEYLRRWATELRVEDLLERALVEAQV